MKISKLNLVILITLIILGICLIVLFLRGNEDDWIKDARGVYVKHGNPQIAYDYVLAQQKIINCAHDLYENAKLNKIRLNSQCLGSCQDYSVDIVNVPRIPEDDLVQNQCKDYLDGITKHFIELDLDGNVVRIV